MIEEQKFFYCKICNAMVTTLKCPKCSMTCCGEKMEELVANSVDAAQEKHKPFVTLDAEGNVSVRVGEVPHPMLPEHYIEWVFIQTNKGGAFKYLNPGEEPVVSFATADGEEVIRVYEHCNVHGLWVTEL